MGNQCPSTPDHYCHAKNTQHNMTTDQLYYTDFSRDILLHTTKKTQQSLLVQLLADSYIL